jgi:hypothetical protein
MRFLKNVKREQLIGMAIQVINCRHATWFHGRNKKICGKKSELLLLHPSYTFYMIISFICLATNCVTNIDQSKRENKK